MSRSVLDPAQRSTPVIDHRLRARRIEVRRDEGRRRLRRLLILAGLTLAAMAAWGATRSPLLDVDEIAVSGLERTSLDAALAATLVERGDALVDLDLARAEQGLASLPWVATVESSRTWGGLVTFAVTERTPVAVLVDAAGGGWFVDAAGRVLGVVAEAPELADGLVRVVGVAPPARGLVIEPHPTALLDLAATLPASVRAAIDTVVVDPVGESWVVLPARAGEVDAEGAPRTDGGRIRLGDLRDVGDLTVSLTTVLARVDLTDLVLLDLRVPSNPVVVERVGGGAE